jgi:hypothetical protein
VGPDLSHLYWSMRYAETLGRRDREITQHYYALWACPGTARPSIHALLGGRVRAVEDKLLARLSGAAVTAGRPAAISETNSVGCNGTAGVSRTFASSLWALDWVLRAASAGVARIGFHDLLQRCTARTYSPLCARRPGQTLALAPQPDFYGLLAAARLENGWFMHVTVRGPSYLTAYATRAAGGTIHLALDDMDTRNASHTVIVRLDGRYRASVERLTGPRLGATRGVRFGAAMVSSSGGFRPHGRPLRDRAGSLGLKLPGGSAAVLTLTPLR